MKVYEPFTRKELYERARRFIDDKNKHITVKLFCELVGCSIPHFRNVFLYQKESMSEDMQRKASRAFRLLENGEVAGKRVNSPYKPDTLVFLKKPVYRAGRAMLLEYDEQTGFSLKARIINKNAYNIPKLDLTDKK